MAIINAFSALRPREEYASLVASLPYDVLNSDEARELVKDNPYSFLRVEKPEIDLDRSIDIYDDRVYAKAVDNLNWLSGAMIRDKKPNLYIYRLIMDNIQQTGLVACTALDDYLSGVIKRHELTREDKERDRTRLIEATQANTSPILMVYPNKANPEIRNRIADYTSSNAPIYDFTSDDGITHQVWVVSCGKDIGQLTEEFKSLPVLYIADGHHRSASAATVGLKRRNNSKVNMNESRNSIEDHTCGHRSSTAASACERHNSAETNACEHHNRTEASACKDDSCLLSVIFPDIEMRILDYNRVVADLNDLSADELLKRLEEQFIVTPSETQVKPEKQREFGMYLSKKWYRIEYKGMMPNSDIQKDALDVSILQNELLKPILGITDPRSDRRIDFVGGLRGLGELEKRVNSGEMAVAFSLYPTSMSQLMAIADAGEVMPPKSTWFEPKLRSGLFVNMLK